MVRNKRKNLKVLLILLSILASLKMLFFAVGMDEEYQLVMSYRNAMGDRLFLDMWEPHQSSAFLCTLLMKPYLMLFGTTGIIIYLRVWGTLLHLGVSFYLYKTLRHFVSEDHAWLLALLYYNIIPKQIILPEFGIMQVWFYTLLSLFLMKYSMECKIRYLILSAVALALNVLSYPSCLILFPFALLWLARFSGKHKWRDMGIFTAVCGACAAAYLGMLFSYTPPYPTDRDLVQHFKRGHHPFPDPNGQAAALWKEDPIYGSPLAGLPAPCHGGGKAKAAGASHNRCPDHPAGRRHTALLLDCSGHRI